MFLRSIFGCVISKSREYITQTKAFREECGASDTALLCLL